MKTDSKEKDTALYGPTSREFRELDVEELVRGYIRSADEQSYSCIFCGKTYEEGIIYSRESSLLTAERAVKEHVASEHGGTFSCLLAMDKQVNGLTDIQKNMMQSFYEDQNTEAICSRMDITPATVRTHRHNLQKMKREAKILLALMEQLEAENRPPLPQPRQETPAQPEAKETLKEAKTGIVGGITGDFTGNTLHPFFTQRRFD